MGFPLGQTPVINALSLNSQLASGALETLVINNITNLIHNEYAFILLTSMCLSAFTDDVFVNGDNFLASLFAHFNNGDTMMLYDYYKFVEIHSWFGQRLHSINDLIFQLHPTDPIEFSGYFFKIPPYNDLYESGIFRPYRDEMQHALAMTLTERTEQVNLYGDEVGTSMLLRSMATTSTLVNGASCIYKWLFRHDPYFHKIMNDIRNGEMDEDRVQITTYDLTNSKVTSIIPFKQFVIGRGTSETNRMPVHLTSSYYGIPQICKENVLIWNDTDVSRNEDEYTVQSVNFETLAPVESKFIKGKIIETTVSKSSLESLYTQNFVIKNKGIGNMFEFTKSLFRGEITATQIRSWSQNTKSVGQNQLLHEFVDTYFEDAKIASNFDRRIRNLINSININ
jgi:hypothetical protein